MVHGNGTAALGTAIRMAPHHLTPGTRTHPVLYRPETTFQSRRYRVDPRLNGCPHPADMNRR